MKKEKAKLVEDAIKAQSKSLDIEDEKAILDRLKPDPTMVIDRLTDFDEYTSAEKKPIETPIPPNVVEFSAQGSVPRMAVPTALERANDVERLCEYSYHYATEEKDKIAWVNTRIRALMLIHTIEKELGKDKDNELNIRFI